MRLAPSPHRVDHADRLRGRVAAGAAFATTAIAELLIIFAPPEITGHSAGPATWPVTAWYWIVAAGIGVGLISLALERTRRVGLGLLAGTLAAVLAFLAFVGVVGMLVGS